MAASAVLNGARTSSRISAATRTRILAAAARLCYRPNAAARALARRRINTLGVAGVVESGELNQYFPEILHGILSAAAEHGQTVTVFTVNEWERDAARLAAYCDGRIDGLILVSPVLSMAAARTLPDHAPFVSINADCRLPGVVNIEPDDERGALELVRHLISRGHRRILHLSGPPGLQATKRRLRGYRRALAEARIPFAPEWVTEGGFTLDQGRSATRAWLAHALGHSLPDAIFCVNDSCAVGCLEALAEAGLRVPSDVSVAGFDDTLVARTTVPQLTTVHQPLREMGRRAVAALLAMLDEARKRPSDTVSEPLIFPVELRLRGSVSIPPAARSTRPG
jgi:LacI family transcriptional regulator